MRLWIDLRGFGFLLGLLRCASPLCPSGIQLLKDRSFGFLVAGRLPTDYPYPFNVTHLGWIIYGYGDG